MRQKTYIEHVIAEELEPVETPYYNVKCAGMPKQCKDLFLMAVNGFTDEEAAEHTEMEQAFLYTDKEHKQHRSLSVQDFTVGLAIPGKLLPKRIPGGVLLVDSVYEMR